MKTIYAAVAAMFTLGYASVAAAMPGDRPGDAAFCNNYAFTTKQFVDGVLARNPSCLDYGKGVHGDYQMHYSWCQRTPRESVEGAARAIRNYGNRCLAAAQGGGKVGGNAPRPAPAPAPAQGKSFYTVVEGADVPGLCVDIAGGILRPGTPIQLWQCHHQAPQRFRLNPNLGLVFAAAAPSLCVDGAPQTQLRLVACKAVTTRWRYDRRTNTVRSDNGMCWDVRAANFRQRTQMIAYPCHNGVNQQFVLND